MAIIDLSPVNKKSKLSPSQQFALDTIKSDPVAHNIVHWEKFGVKRLSVCKLIERGLIRHDRNDHYRLYIVEQK